MLFPSRSVSWLAVFLGNPGLRYEGTRHNAGFMTADALARKKNVSINRARFRALTATCPIGDETVMLMKPQTYMNLSGEAVGQAARFYKIPADHVLVVSDDITLPIGALRIRTKGSAGGHTVSGSASRRIPTMTRSTGCCRCSATRMPSTWPTQPPAPPTRWSASSPRVPKRP